MREAGADTGAAQLRPAHEPLPYDLVPHAADRACRRGRLRGRARLWAYLLGSLWYPGDWAHDRRALPSHAPHRGIYSSVFPSSRLPVSPSTWLTGCLATRLFSLLLVYCLALHHPLRSTTPHPISPRPHCRRRHHLGHHRLDLCRRARDALHE